VIFKIQTFKIVIIWEKRGSHQLIMRIAQNFSDYGCFSLQNVSQKCTWMAARTD